MVRKFRSDCVCDDPDCEDWLKRERILWEAAKVIDEMKIVRDYEQSVPINDIQDNYKISQTKLYRILRKHKITLRNLT